MKLIPGIILASVLAIGIALIAHFATRETPTAERVTGPAELRDLPTDLIASTERVRAEAAERVYSLLCDHEAASTGIRIRRTESVVPAVWYEAWGGPRMRVALHRRVAEGIDADQAIDLLWNLHQQYERDSKTRRRDVPETAWIPSRPLHALAVAEVYESSTDDAVAFVALQLAQRSEPVGWIDGAVLLRRLSSTESEDASSAVIRLLRNVSEAELRSQWKRVAGNRATSYAPKGWGRLVEDRIGVRGPLGEWLSEESPRPRRVARLDSLLDIGGSSARRALALQRFEPLREIEGRVTEMAGDPDLDSSTRRAAIEALAARPGAQSAHIVVRGLDDPVARPASVKVLTAWTGDDLRLDDPNSDWETRALRRIEAERRLLQAGRWEDTDKLTAVLSRAIADDAQALRDRCSALRVLCEFRRRRELGEAWWSSSEEAVRSSVNARSDELREWTWRALILAGRCSMDELLRALDQESVPTVRQALLDGVVAGTPPPDQTGVVDRLIETISTNGSVRGLELVRAFWLVDRSRTLSNVLVDRARTAVRPDSRAAACYLLGALPPVIDGASGEPSRTLVRALGDDYEGARLWAHAVLRQHYPDGPSFDPTIGPRNQMDAIETWAQRIQLGPTGSPVATERDERPRRSR